MDGAGAYILAPVGLSVSPNEAAFFRAADPWGFILFARNCETPDQIRRLTNDLRAALGRNAPILIDQEGGRVQRLRGPTWREWLPPLDQVHRVPFGRAMWLRGALLAQELLGLGIDVNCVPSADIAWPDTHAFLKNRCYGDDPLTVVAMARACAEGVLDGGGLPVLKHAPGHGRATVDSHVGLPRIAAPMQELMQTDFAAFAALSHLPMVMTAHIVLPDIDPERPVTLSPDGIAFLRGSLGLDGLMLTDDISMGALSGTVAQRAGAAIAAGCDLVLHCNGDIGEMEAVAGAVGHLSPQAAKRADIALSAKRTPTDIDISALEAEFEALIEGAEDA